MSSKTWLLFLSQLPTNPSSLRVMVWRRMRGAGAASLQNGVWALPDDPTQREFTNNLLTSVQQQGGSGQIFEVQPLSAEVEADLIARMRADREQEYIEFNEGCSDLLGELEKETARSKFTFAELEENEQNLQRLERWLEKIRARDFYPTAAAQQAADQLNSCRAALETYAAQVYVHQGLDTSSADNPPS
ncbi:MAG: Chromate resistance protein ChrB [Anaerolineaceae bacterium]